MSRRSEISPLFRKWMFDGYPFPSPVLDEILFHLPELKFVVGPLSGCPKEIFVSFDEIDMKIVEECLNTNYNDVETYASTLRPRPISSFDISTLSNTLIFPNRTVRILHELKAVVWKYDVPDMKVSVEFAFGYSIIKKIGKQFLCVATTVWCIDSGAVPVSAREFTLKKGEYQELIRLMDVSLKEIAEAAILKDEPNLVNRPS